MTASKSFIEVGIPPSGPVFSPFAIFLSIFFASSKDSFLATYKKALVLFKEKLNEVAVFNANLAYATRLFTEHSTTRQEKLNILKRFDSVTSLTESKSTYKTIKTELDSSKNITETVVDKIASTPTTSSSQEVLSETKAYESPQFKRMKDLMSKLK